MPVRETGTLTARSPLIIAFVLSFVLLVPLVLEAAPLRLTPSITLEERFDDNIFTSEDDREHDFVTMIKPALELSREGARLKSQATYAVRFEVFSRHSELNQWRPFQTLDGTAALSLGKGAQLQLDENLSYAPEQPEFLGASNVGNILGEGIRTRREESIRNVAGVNLRQPITEKVILKTEYQNGISRYDDPSMIDSTRHEVSAGIAYEIASWSVPSFEYRYQAIAFGDEKDSSVHYVNLRYSHKMAPILSADLSAGAAFPRRSKDEDHKPQFVGAVGIHRALKDWEWRIRYARQMGTSGGFVRELSISDRVSVSLSREVWRNLTATLTGNYAQNRSIEGEAVDINSRGIQLGMDYAFAPGLSLNLRYSYFRQDSDGQVATDIVRNQVLISLTASRL